MLKFECQLVELLTLKHVKHLEGACIYIDIYTQNIHIHLYTHIHIKICEIFVQLKYFCTIVRSWKFKGTSYILKTQFLHNVVPKRALIQIKLGKQMLNVDHGQINIFLYEALKQKRHFLAQVRKRF